MIQNAKAAKAVISAIALSAFVYWGLDHDTICKAVGDTSQTCGYFGKNDVVNMVGSVFVLMLTVLTVAMLWAWAGRTNQYSCYSLRDAG
ncbi:hypothetical protein J4S47_005037 [Salmonella enterica]|nr:hypothetical protein [Salmonella enterica]